MGITKEPIIEKIDLDNASLEVKKAVDDHLAMGYRITNEKLTLLHNVPCFTALEVHSYAVDRELQKIVGERAAEFFEYAISLENDCIVCSTYFAKKARQLGITDLYSFDFTDDEKLLIDYARAIANDVKNIPQDIYDRLKARFSDEEIVVITTMGVFMVANNYFNDILRVEPETL